MSASVQTPCPDRLETRLERCRRVLDAVSDAGMKLLEALDPEAPDASVRDLSLAYCRIARTLRLTLMLDQRLDALAAGGMAALIAERALAAQAQAETPDAESPDTDPPEKPERREDGRIRLDREAPDEALRYLSRPLPELVAAICKGFGLSPEETTAALDPFEALVANDDAPQDPPEAAAKVAASGPGRPRNPLKSRLMSGSAPQPLRAQGP